MKTSVFQYVVVAVFTILGVGGVIYFATSDPEKNDEVLQGAAGNVVIWGTFQENGDLTTFFHEFNQKYRKAFTVSYVAHDPKTFDQDIVEALASGTGPDILVLPDNLVMRHTDKILPMSYVPNFGQREYLSTFVQASEVYLRKDGMLAYPLAIDPMVVYWNRDLFNNASIAQPPKYWDELLVIAPKLTKKDKTLKITQSAIPFGEFDNVKNAKDILVMLFMQVGSPMVQLGANGSPAAALRAVSGIQGYSNDAIIAALRYFMDYSNPQKTIYTWSRSRANSEEEFINGNLAIYFDYASRYQSLKDLNPHLNFDVAPVPQIRDGKAEITTGRMYGLVTMKTSKNQSTAFTAIRLLLEQSEVEKFSKIYNLPPVRRDLLSVRPTDAVKAAFYDAAIRVRVWLDPKPDQTDLMFQNMVSTVSSGRNDAETAINEAHARLVNLVEPYQVK